MSARRVVTLATVLAGCSASDTSPRFAVYPRELELGPTRASQASADIGWTSVAVQNETYFALDVRRIEIVGGGAPFLEWRLPVGGTQTQAPVRGRALLDVRVAPSTAASVATWSSGEREAELRFEIGGTGVIDSQTQLPDLGAYEVVPVTLPIRFALDCDSDGDGYDAVACSGGGDCDDQVAAINPNAPELCDGIDNDCDDAVDDADIGGCDEP